MELSQSTRFSSGWLRLALCCVISATATLLFLLGVGYGLLLANFWLLLFVPWLGCVGWFLAAQPIRGKPFLVKLLFAFALAITMAAVAILAFFLGVLVFPG